MFDLNRDLKTEIDVLVRLLYCLPSMFLIFEYSFAELFFVVWNEIVILRDQQRNLYPADGFYVPELIE